MSYNVVFDPNPAANATSAVTATPQVVNVLPKMVTNSIPAKGATTVVKAKATKTTKATSTKAPKPQTVIAPVGVTIAKKYVVTFKVRKDKKPIGYTTQTPLPADAYAIKVKPALPTDWLIEIAAQKTFDNAYSVEIGTGATTVTYMKSKIQYKLHKDTPCVPPHHANHYGKAHKKPKDEKKCTKFHLDNVDMSNNNFFGLFGIADPKKHSKVKITLKPR